jgi:hypothetical protein
MQRFIVKLLMVMLLISVPLIAAGEPRWNFCANEGGVCEFRGTANVRYGAEGRYTSKTATNGINCDNSAFGDPAPGMPKRCFFVPVYEPKRGYVHGRFCSDEGGFCEVRGRAKVRYGAEGRYVYKTVRRGIDCNNAAFGGDPAPGLAKQCHIVD